MKMNKEKFLKTEVGAELKNCIISWDRAIEERRTHSYSTEEYKRAEKTMYWCQAQWEVYKMVIRQFFGIEYNFTRTDECFGLVTEDETDWLFRVDREQ